MRGKGFRASRRQALQRSSERTRLYESARPGAALWLRRPDRRRERLPAITHVDGTGRLQSVDQASNPLYYRLIQAFQRWTGVGVVLNTSFNENEPVVCTPAEALDCFLRTKMDVLVMGNWVVRRG